MKLVLTDTGSFNVKATFRQVWFKFLMRDPASLLQMLSIAVIERAKKSGGDTNKSLSYYQRALRSVNERLGDPILGLSDGIIGSIMCFLTYCHAVGDIKRYRIHKAGLAKIIELRGGIETLQGDGITRLMVHWTDILGATKFDIPPSYGPPELQIRPEPNSRIPLSPNFLKTRMKWELLFPERADTLTLLMNLNELNSSIIAGLPDSWDDTWLLGLRIHPIVIPFLYPYPDVTISTVGETVERAVRLASLVYLADARMRCMAHCTMGYHFVERLRTVAVPESPEWDDFLELRLWILVVGAVKASAEDRDLFGAAIKVNLNALGANTWDEAMNIVRSFIWMEELYGQSARDLGVDIMILANDR